MKTSDVLFEFCTDIMQSMGSLFNVSYTTINVILFCLIEPLLFGLSLCMIADKAFAFQGYELRTFWTSIFVVSVIFIVFLVLLFSLIRLYRNPDKITESLSYPNGMFSELMFWWTYWILMKIARLFHTSYSVVNLAVYVVICPIVILLGIII